MHISLKTNKQKNTGKFGRPSQNAMCECCWKHTCFFVWPWPRGYKFDPKILDEIASKKHFFALRAALVIISNLNISSSGGGS